MIALLIACLIIIPNGLVNVLGEQTESPENILAQEINRNNEILPRQVNLTEPQPVNLHFSGGDGGDLRAEMPEGNSSTEVPCSGSPVPRAFGLLVGIWTSPSLSFPITLGSTISCSLWAKSNQGANNVHFNCQILINDNQIMDIWTNSQSLSSEPIEFIGDGNNEGGSIQLQPGDTIAARVYYFSDPMIFVGPGPDATLLVGSIKHDTCISITTCPIAISVNEPIITDAFVIFTATYLDAFGCTKLNARLWVDGKVDVETVSKPTFTTSPNGSIVSWNWDYKADGAECGEYTVTVLLCYSEENEFRTTNSYILEFPGTHEEGGLGWLLPVILVIIVVAVAVIVIKIIKDRRELRLPT